MTILGFSAALLLEEAFAVSDDFEFEPLQADNPATAKHKTDKLFIKPIVNCHFFTLKLKASGSFFKPSGRVTVTLPPLQEYFTLLPFCNRVILPVGSLPSHSMVAGSVSF